MPQKPAASLNELDTLVTVSIESEDPGSGETIARIHLGGVNWGADDPNGPGNQTDGSHGQADMSRGWADTPNVPYSAKTTGIHCNNGAETYLSIGGPK